VASPETIYPNSVPVEHLERPHEKVTFWASAWTDYSVLHAGGEVIRQQAARFLSMRAKEPGDVYNARVARFVYTNLLGTILGWYSAKMFRRPPQIDVAPKDEAGKPTDGPLPADAQTFVDAFLESCDRGGTSFVDFFRPVFQQILLYQDAYILLDLPKSDPDIFENRAQQMDAGALDVYITLWTPQMVLNWDEDEQGDYEWVLLRTSRTEKALFGDDRHIDRWTIFDTQQVAVYETVYTDKQERPKNATLAEGSPRPHALADLGKVPLYKICIPSELWIADRISLPMRNYLNTENGLDWALSQNNLAIPVIIGGRVDEASFTKTEVGMWSLPDATEVKYLEQSGTAFNSAKDRLEQIREEIYRSSYLMDQGRSTAATPASQSGISKQADKEPANDTLNAYGDILRLAMQQILSDALAVRKIADLAVNVRGFTFADQDPNPAIDAATKVLDLSIPSPTLDKELQKQVAILLLPDANEALKTKIANEIDTAPTKQEQAAQQMEQQQAAFARGFGAVQQQQAPPQQQAPDTRMQS
jgi:hypothetical protein